MNQLLSKHREKRARGEDGFTLIELLVVVVIIGVLIAIAIPLYLNYRKGANDAAAESDMHNAVNTLEQCNTDNGIYPLQDMLLKDPGGSAGTCKSQQITLSSGTSLQYRVGANPVNGGSYTIVDLNVNGAGKSFCYNSSKGGQVKAMAAPLTDVSKATLDSC